MTRYINVKVNISEGQKEKLQHAIKAGYSAVSIRLGHEDIQGNDIIAPKTSSIQRDSVPLTLNSVRSFAWIPS